jgi:integrase
VRRASVPAEWALAVDGWLASLRLAGRPETTVDTRRQHLHYLARRIGVPPSEVTGEHLAEWFRAQGWAQESKRSRTTSYRLFWKWAKRNLGIPNAAKMLPRVKPAEPTPRPTPDRVYMKALMRSDRRTRLILRLAAEAGLRRGEIALVNTETDLIEDMVGWSLIVHGKGGKIRIVPLTEGIALELLELPAGWAFPGAIDGHLSPRRVGELGADALDGVWTLHTLRHRFATRTYDIDHDVFGVQELLGHASPDTTRRYVARDRARLRELVQLAAG